MEKKLKCIQINSSIDFMHLNKKIHVPQIQFQNQWNQITLFFLFLESVPQIHLDCSANSFRVFRAKIYINIHLRKLTICRNSDFCRLYAIFCEFHNIFVSKKRLYIDVLGLFMFFFVYQWIRPETLRHTKNRAHKFKLN